MKEALGMEHFSLKRLSVEVSFTGDPGRYVEKGPAYGRLSYRGPFMSERNLESGGGAHIPGTLNDE